MHLDDRMTRQECIAEAVRPILPGGSEGTLITIERRENHGRAGVQGDAGGIRELLQRHDICVELRDHTGHAIGIVLAVRAHAGVHVVGGHAERRRRQHLPESRRLAVAGEREDEEQQASDNRHHRVGDGRLHERPTQQRAEATQYGDRRHQPDRGAA
jgi:hypothetical protein